MVSLGVQSFDDKILNYIQRQHSAAIAKSALVTLSKKGFSSLNVDLLFAIKGQNWASVENDLKCARDLGATQITCYPLFTFPFTEIGRYLNLKRVKLPPSAIRKNIYYRIHDWCQKNGFNVHRYGHLLCPETTLFLRLLGNILLVLGQVQGHTMVNNFILIPSTLMPMQRN